jgi:Recombination endonuclease VII
MRNKLAACHPQRFHKAKGFCGSCYDRYLKTINAAYKARQAKNVTGWLRKNPDARRRLNAARRVRELNDPLRYQKKRAASLKSKYGLSLEAYNALLIRQNGGCAICYRRPGVKPLHVDHDHATGVVRGLLCHQCNWYLGTIDSDPAILTRIAMYRDRKEVLAF